MKSNYSKVFSGNQFEAKKIASELQKIGIEAIIKDEAESARLGGFASSTNSIYLYVHQDELEKAQKVINQVS
ncbi:DUF2007 domain-containing protein [Aurantibacter sp.]|uniref:putative signal transducing protein n=1 Tax=Aurantibacter sp. TaxID=2807103 RepID=UPI003265EA2A